MVVRLGGWTETGECVAAGWIIVRMALSAVMSAADGRAQIKGILKATQANASLSKPAERTSSFMPGSSSLRMPCSSFRVPLRTIRAVADLEGP